MSHTSCSTTWAVTTHPFTPSLTDLVSSSSLEYTPLGVLMLLFAHPTHPPTLFFHPSICLLLVQGDRGHLAELLSKQAFRMDAISFAATAKRHASVAFFDHFVVTSCQLGVVVILKDNLDANRHTTVNERSAVNSMLVLNKIRTVRSCCLSCVVLQ